MTRARLAAGADAEGVEEGKEEGGEDRAASRRRRESVSRSAVTYPRPPRAQAKGWSRWWLFYICEDENAVREARLTGGGCRGTREREVRGTGDGNGGTPLGRRQPHECWRRHRRIYHGRKPSYRHTHLLPYVLTATAGLHHEPCCSSLNVHSPFILPGAERSHWSTCFVFFHGHRFPSPCLGSPDSVVRETLPPPHRNFPLAKGFGQVVRGDWQYQAGGE